MNQDFEDLKNRIPVSTTVENAPSDVNHPSHYCSHPAKIECIEVTEHMNFNLGNAVKYIWRNGLKATSTAEKDLQKAIWYLRREIERITK